LARCGVAGLTACFALGAVGELAAATADWEQEAGRVVHRAGKARPAIVALRQQRVTFYDREGRMARAPVSTGATGLETPAGVYSVVQKEPLHQSNVYEDGLMPFMQRITWTGIALHAGPLPGYPASHGCVRMPYAFARSIYDMTEVGMRVIVVPDDIAPSDISHPGLFQPDVELRQRALRAHSRHYAVGEEKVRAPARLASARQPQALASSQAYAQLLQELAGEKKALAAEAAKRAEQAKAAARRTAVLAAPATRDVTTAERKVAKAQEALSQAERALTAATPERLAVAQDAKAKAEAQLALAASLLETARAQAASKVAAEKEAEDAAQSAETARLVALQAAGEAARRLEPVSVFVSRKMQRLYIRQGYQPVDEFAVAIRDAETAIGSYVFTAIDERSDGGVRWSVVSMYPREGRSAVPHEARQRAIAGGEPASADVEGARANLDRIEIPQHARDRIADLVLPGSSLIISDEGPSIETGKDTDFVVQ
jgi:hypothetical protein